MLDVRRLRDDLDGLKAGLARRGIDLSEVERAAELDQQARSLGSQRDALRARVNAISKEVGQAKRGGDIATAENKSQESRAGGVITQALAPSASGPPCCRSTA